MPLVIRIGGVLILYVIAISVSKIAVILDLNGIIFAPVIVFVLPSMLYIKVNWMKLKLGDYMLLLL